MTTIQDPAYIQLLHTNQELCKELENEITINCNETSYLIQNNLCKNVKCVNEQELLF